MSKETIGGCNTRSENYFLAGKAVEAIEKLAVDMGGGLAVDNDNWPDITVKDDTVIISCTVHLPMKGLAKYLTKPRPLGLPVPDDF